MSTTAALPRRLFLSPSTTPYEHKADAQGVGSESEIILLLIMIIMQLIIITIIVIIIFIITIIML